MAADEPPPFPSSSLHTPLCSHSIHTSSQVERLQSTWWGQSFSGAFVNGRALPVVHENDLVGLLQTMQRELRSVDALTQLGLPTATVRSIVSLPAPSSSLRIDAAHPARHLARTLFFLFPSHHV